ncbi:hypothetical protein [uncultured Thiocystis sp.]|uniref:hypothetical protein n=1 Tax=uncultured Thiocystis sp. TaxID=1202134 RepID=UPI003422A320
MHRIEANRGALALSSVTWQEMLYGMLLLPPGRRREQVEDYLLRRVRPSLPILGFEEPAARWRRNSALACARRVDRRPTLTPRSRRSPP